jgi:hypothetical protein
LHRKATQQIVLDRNQAERQYQLVYTRLGDSELHPLMEQRLRYIDIIANSTVEEVIRIPLSRML